MKYYKIILGFTDEISITENELPKALSIFMNANGRAIFENGAVRGQDIMRIVPDWHKVMGWNKGYKIQPEDYQDYKYLEKSYSETYQLASRIAEIVQETKNSTLLSIPLSESIKLLSEENKQISEGANLLADNMKM